MYHPSYINRHSIDMGDSPSREMGDNVQYSSQNQNRDKTNVGEISHQSIHSKEGTLKKPFRILALDGGGARGLMQAIIIGRIVREFPSFLEEVDMIAGTSAGSLNAAYLAMGGTPDLLVNVWTENAKVVFTQTWWHKFKTIFGLNGASYNNGPLISMIKSFSGDMTLAELKKKILIPSFNLDPNDDTDSHQQYTSNVEVDYSGASISGITASSNFYSPSMNVNSQNADIERQSLLRGTKLRRWFPEYFHNFDHSPNSNITVVNACVRSAAAPTYFPIYQGFVDGGVFANNPSLSAISTTICEGIDIEDVIVFSLSTGNNPQYVGPSQYTNGNWGIINWGLKLIDLLMDSTSIAATHQSASLLGDRFFRLDPLLPYEIDLADASPNAISLMHQLAESLDLSPVITWLKKYWQDNKKV